MWHEIGDREESDAKKYEFLGTKGFKVVSLKEDDLQDLKIIHKVWGKER